MSWKRRIKILLASIGLLLAVALAVPFFGLFYPTMRQMHAGRKYMDSLTDVEIQKWIDRSKDYLAHADPNDCPIGARPVPSDLKALKILRIDLHTNSVVYVWCGGFDHTYLTVNERDDSYEVIAGYDDQHSKVVWPKRNANSQSGANGRQPFSSDTNRMSAAAASRGSRSAFAVSK
jgi:hypothetical protein